MRPIDAQFVRRRHRASGFAAAVMVLSLASAGLGLHRAFVLASKVNDARRQLAEVSVKVSKADVQPAATPYDEDARLHAESALFDVGRVLRAVEAARVTGVRVVSVEASSVDGTARVEIELQSQDLLLAYLEAMNAGESRKRWVLVRARAETSQPSSALIAARWERGE